jgi:IQ and AAA domain-containing protein
LLQIEIPKGEPKPETDKLAAFQLLATMYVKYIQIFRKLEECYDQIGHAQKRRLLRAVLDNVMGRLIEIKHEMIKLEYSEYHFFDDVLQDLKLTPQDIEIPVPKYFTLERLEAIKEKEKLLADVLSQMEPTEIVKDKYEIKMSIDEAIRLIQTHERARQGRARAQMYKNLLREMERANAQKGEPTMDFNVAATIIQKYWRGYLTRKRAVAWREEEFMFLGMEPTPMPKDKRLLPQYQSKETEERRRKLTKHNEQDYQQALITIKEKLRQSEGPDIKERMQNQIRQWFLECRDVTGKFPDYPDEDEGGSGMIFKNKSIKELEDDLAEMEVCSYANYISILDKFK